MLHDDLVNNHCWPWNGTIAPKCNVNDQTLAKEVRMQNVETYVEDLFNSIEDVCGDQIIEAGEYFEL